MKAKPMIFRIAAAALLSQSHAIAQATWSSATSGGDWATANAWTIGGSPGSLTNPNGSSALIFDTASLNRVYTNTLTNFTATSITVNSGSKDNTISGNAINLGGTLTVNTGSWQNFNLDMALGSSARTFAITTGRTYFGGILSGTGAAGSNAAILKTGGGELWLTKANTIAGNGSSTVNGSITGAGTYYRALEFNGGGSGTVVLNHTAALGSNSNLVRFAGSGSGILDLQTDTSVNAYSIFSGSGHGGTINAGRATAGAGIIHNLGVLDLSSVTMTVNTGGNVTSGTAGVSFVSLSMSGGNDNNPVKLAGNASISVGPAGITNNTNTTRRLQLDGTHSGNSIGAIADLAPGAAAGTGKVNLIKSNSSTWTLTGANTYSGYTVITGGTLQLGNGGATGTLNPASAIQNGGTLAFNRSGTITQGTDFAATISAYTTDYTTNSAGVPLGTPVLGKLVKSGGGNLILTGSNTLAATDSLTFSGSNSGTVTLRNTSALGAAGNSVRFNGSGSGTLDLQTDTSVNAYHITSGSFNGVTITSNRATTGAGITHSLGSLELGSVTLTANTGSNVTSGTAGVSFTELRMTAGNDNNPVTLGGSASITLGSASITLNGMGKRLQLDGTSASNTVTGVIADSNNSTSGAVVSLIKANTGTWTLLSDNTYTGTTTIKGGTLRINSSTSIAASPTVTIGDAGSSNAVLDASPAGFTIGSSQTVGGIGSILATGQTVTASGTLSPGNSVGTLTIDGGTLVLDGTSDFIFELGTASDQINLIHSATLNLGLNTLGLSDFQFSDSGGFGVGIYTLINGASSFTGALDSADLTGDVLGYNSTLGMSGGNLILTVVPEPGVALLGSIGALALLRRRRAV